VPTPFRLLIVCLALASVTPAQAGQWRLVTQGDCPGPQISGSPGAAPEDEVCTAAFAGKTALCFTQVCYPGCQYIDIPTQACQGGAELAQVYTCVSEPAAAPAENPRAGERQPLAQ
jgi:hypothetical protein